MYHTFSVKNFRGFDDLTIEGLGRINLIGGKSNIGKTALLEALWIHHGSPNPDLAVRVDAFRGLEHVSPDNFLSNLFHGFDRSLTVEFCAEGVWGDDPRLLRMWFEDSSTFEIPVPGLENNHPDPLPNSSLGVHSSEVIVMDYFYESAGRLTVKGRLVERQTSPLVYTTGLDVSIVRGSQLQNRPSAALMSARRAGVSNEDVNRYSQLEINGQQDGILQILQEVEPDLKRLAVVSVGQDTAIYADVGLGRLIPIQLLGDGMSRILSVALAIANAPGGMVLVDEIEKGLHYTVMEKVWKAIAAFARSYNVQIFATTHSRECVYHAYRAFEADEEEEMRFYRIDRGYGKLRSVMYNRKKLGIAFEDGLGIR